ncbi:flagellar basal body-associated protein FliL [Microbacterium trichothecenolyticum]|uniref:Flagellar basal body-associated protein FliL n=1 Tax=Microbacterium trichothecenolyticum TaxID=69370 RepID=A0ABU0TZ01_MICTR|nr:flagellar basal body-associated protein FliL [Microbacterium trichothecenolyticum]
MPWIIIIVLGVLSLIAAVVRVAMIISEGRIDGGTIVGAFGSLIGGIACTSFGWTTLSRSRNPIEGNDER